MDRISMLHNRYKKLFPGSESLKNNYIENTLKIKLPRDFQQISQFFEGSNLRFGLFCLDDLISENVSYRNAYNPLPPKYLALGENSVSFIVLDTETGKVIEMATNDYGNLVEGEELCDNPQFFNSYSDFFEYLLDEEEKERAENVE